MQEFIGIEESIKRIVVGVSSKKKTKKTDSCISDSATISAESDVFSAIQRLETKNLEKCVSPFCGQ